jgi:hypothetical protein
MNRLFWIASFANLFFAVSNIQAHRQPEALTAISYNPNTGSTEIVHQLHAHDAERVLEELPANGKTPIDTVEGQARLALYVEERFELADQNGNLLSDVKLLGAELEGDTLYAYQEYVKALPRTILIRNDILRDILPDQVNTVNVHTEAGIRTLVFSDKDKWKTLK